ncbi:hypothetical protein BGZ49_002717 [Haplosporangium sp. Z 27]|nr:hypothetical protein BGZ49_002717 [Haplosporangium sp. Z 27]
MYIQGGRSYSGSNGVLTQMFSIDLTTSWSADSPAYKQMPDGLYSSRVANTLIGDNNWFFVVNQTGYAYNIPGSNWTNIGSQSSISSSLGLAAASNPVTGRVYIPNGYKDSVTGLVYLMIYYSVEQQLNYNTMPSSLNNIINYNAVWTPTISSVLVFGGNVDGYWTTNNNLNAYSPDSGWSSPSVKGSVPPARTLACMVAANSGATIVVFGGVASSVTNTSGAAYNDIYFLDVASYTWTRGADLNIGGGRASHSCAASGDYFISWGGYGDTDSTVNTLIYNMKTNTWTNQYAPPSPSKSNSVPIIAGCVAGAVVIILLVGGFIWHRKRSNNRAAAATAAATKPGELVAFLPNQQPQQQFQPVPAPLPQAQYYPQQPYAVPQPVDQQNIAYQMTPIPQQQPDPGYYTPASQQPHVYQPPLMATDQRTQSIYQATPVPEQPVSYYQPADQQPQVYQPPLMPSPIPSDQSTGYYPPSSQQPSIIYQPPVTHTEHSQHIYQPSPNPSDQSTGHYQTTQADFQSPQISAHSGTPASPQAILDNHTHH